MMSEVLEIGTFVGPQGGEMWKLTLKCGHVAHRRRHSMALKMTDKALRAGPKYAPKRVLCHICDVLRVRPRQERTPL